VKQGSEGLEEVRVAHASHGRVRLKVDRLKGDESLAARLEHALSSTGKAIERVEANPLTGSLLLTFAADELGIGELADIAGDAVTDELTEEFGDLIEGALRTSSAPSVEERGGPGKIQTLGNKVPRKMPPVRTTLPVSLAALGIGSLVRRGPVPLPTWYEYLWYAFAVYSMTNHSARR
jgi:Heavy metal associated domain 2